jgi:hypothetical protein
MWLSADDRGLGAARRHGGDGAFGGKKLTCPACAWLITGSEMTTFFLVYSFVILDYLVFLESQMTKLHFFKNLKPAMQQLLRAPRQPPCEVTPPDLAWLFAAAYCTNTACNAA